MATTTDSITRRFAAACGLLSQYAARTAATAPVPSPFVQQPAGTVVQEGGANHAQQQQLTIFYGGMVVVLDGCTPEKAAELIRLAAAASGHGEPRPMPMPMPMSTQALVDIPIARNASLRRFLSKRKDRASATAPVPDSTELLSLGRKDQDPAAKKGKLLEESREEAASWLALGSLGSMHAR